MWDAHTGRRIAGPLQHGEDVPYAEFDPSGELVATASWDQTARVWEVASGRLHIPPLQHNDDVYHVSFSPDGRWLVTASRDQTARVWDARTGQALTTPLRHDGAVYYASFSPDSRRLVTGSADGKARLLTLHADGRPVGELRLLAQLLSGSRVDGAGGALPLRPSDLRDAWVRLRLGRHK